MTARATSLDIVFRGLRLASEPQRPVAIRNEREINDALAADLVASGIDRSAVGCDQAAAEVPGYRRLMHRWDLVLLKGGLPRVVVEWKYVRTPEGLNRRFADVIAGSTSLRISFEKADANGYAPLVAVLFILDLPPNAERAFSAFADQVRDMVDHQVVDCACVLYFDRTKQHFVDFNENLAFDQFASAIGIGMQATTPGRSLESDGAIRLGQLLSTGDVAGVVTGLMSTSVGLTAVEAAAIASRRHIIADLQALAAADDTTETVMHRAIGGNYWIFGGQYVGIAPRRDFALLDQHDFPLLCADGSIQIVELKSPGCTLVRKYRSHYIVTNEVHEAISQCLNYLRSLDEQGAILQTIYRNELGIDNIDFRRARGTVVIGALRKGSAAERSQVVQTMRSYNAHLARIQVITYSELLDSADRALKFEEFTEDTAISTED